VTTTQTLTLDLALTAAHPQAHAMESLDWQGWLGCWAAHMEVQGSPIQAYELALKLTDDDDIRDLNRVYRHKDQPTDVLAFAALETDSVLPPELLAVEPLYLGDIVISLDTAERQAQAEGHSLLHETLWLTAHGFLHLLGWDHPDDQSLEAMLTQQKALFALIDGPEVV
jgi:probable rRNA maturation factor